MVKAVAVKFRHPAYEAEDVALTLTRVSEGVFGTSETVRDGVWIVEIDADAGAARPYRDVRRVVIAGGTLK